MLRLRSYVPLKGEGLRPAMGENANELLAPAVVKQPKVAEGINPQSPIIPSVYEYDIDTKAGQEITVERYNVG